MAYTITKNLVPTSKYAVKCPYTMTPTRIVIHNTANDATAANEIAYMIRNDYEVSFHYAIDDTQVVQGILETRNAWHAGDGANGAGNRQGIAIEICYSLSGGTRFINAEKNAAKFTATMLKKYGWGISKVTKHQDYSGKYCPHRTLDMGWQRFLNMVSAELTALNPAPAPTPTPTTPKITYQPMTKKVKLNKDANLWDFNFTAWADAKTVASYPKGSIMDIAAMATNSLGGKYYMTPYSYDSGKIKFTRGFNVVDCDDYTPPPVVVEPPVDLTPPTNPEVPDTLEEANVEPTAPSDTPPPTTPVTDESEYPNWFVNFWLNLFEAILKLLGIKK